MTTLNIVDGACECRRCKARGPKKYTYEQLIAKSRSPEQKATDLLAAIFMIMLMIGVAAAAFVAISFSAAVNNAL